jgi:hypothetical protein
MIKIVQIVFIHFFFPGTMPRLIFILLLAFLWGGCASTTNQTQDRKPASLPKERPQVPVFKRLDNVLPKGLNANYVNVLDVNNDGLPDLLIAGSRLFLNQSADGQIMLKDITEQAGIKSHGPALAVDIDNDGWTDIVTTRGHIYRNNGDLTFTDIAKLVGFAPHRKALTLAAGDLDNNGFPDLVIGMTEDWNDGNPEYYPLQLWLNDQGLAFRECAKTARINKATYARSILIHDVNQDGYQDIFVANYRLQPNFLWINRKNGSFFDEARQRGVRGRYNTKMFYDRNTAKYYGYRFGHSIGAAFFDLDGDGQLDLWVSNLVHKYVGVTTKNKLGFDVRGYHCDDSAIFHNKNGFFTDWRKDLGIPLEPIGGRGIYRGDELWSGVAVADPNLDGYPDAYVPQIYNLIYAKAKLFVNHEGTLFSDVASEAGIHKLDSYTAAWADLDNDGLIDLVAAGRDELNGTPKLDLYKNLGNDVINARNWIKVKLNSSKKGTAIGAIIAVKANQLTQTAINSAGSSSFGQQSDPVFTFGLGSYQGDVQVIVTWPDQSVTQHNAKTKSTLILTR